MYFCIFVIRLAPRAARIMHMLHGVAPGLAMIASNTTHLHDITPTRLNTNQSVALGFAVFFCCE